MQPEIVGVQSQDKQHRRLCSKIVCCWGCPAAGSRENCPTYSVRFLKLQACLLFNYGFLKATPEGNS